MTIMISIATAQDGTFSGIGIDLLDGMMAVCGCGEAVALDGVMIGASERSAVFDFAMGGADGVALDVAQTGTAGDAAPLLAGSSGADTLDGVDVADTGFDSLHAVVARTTVGANILLSRGAPRAASASCGFGVALNLHRIELFSIGYRTGCAA